MSMTQEEFIKDIVKEIFQFNKLKDGKLTLNKWLESVQKCNTGKVLIHPNHVGKVWEIIYDNSNESNQILERVKGHPKQWAILFDEQLGPIQEEKEEEEEEKIDYYHEGLVLYMKAKKGEFEDRECVKKSIQMLCKAIEEDSENLKPYVLLTTIFGVFKDYTQALMYLDELEKVDPDNHDLPLL